MDKIRDINPSQVPTYLKRAEECLASMQREFEEKRWDSCVILAIHAAISAADALCVAMLGKRNASESHRDSVILFQRINPNDMEIRKAAMRLGDLLSIKTDAEYGERSQSQGDAELAKLNAERLVSFVRKRVSSSA